jgi:Ca2+-binding RTX toxin-like protein
VCIRGVRKEAIPVNRLRAHIALPFAIAAFCGLAPVAHAATASVSDGTLLYTSGAGEANHVVLTVSAGRYVIADGSDQVSIPTTGVTELAIDTGDGNDTISLTTSTPATISDGPGDDTVTGGSGADTFLAGTGKDVFNGGSGTDRVSYAGRAGAVTASIDGVANDGAPGELDNVTTTVEQLEGGEGDDSLTGSTAANRLVGGYGDDSLNGSSGDDQLDGGPGADDLNGGTGTRDVADYSARTYPVIASIDGAAGDGESGEGDNIRTDVEGIWGGSADDRLTGGAAADDLRGNAGDDWFRGVGGADTMSGGTGQDTADYGERTTGVTVTDDGIANDGASGELDNVGTDVDDLVGGSGNDTLTGSSWSQTLTGGAGNDTLNGAGGDDVLDGGSGADRMLGGSGTDSADYSARSAPVTVTVADTGRGDGESGEGDDVTSDVEKVLGGSAGDTLTGSSGANTLLGAGGDDRLFGSGGSDTLDGGSGDDRLDGGSGADSITGGDGSDTLDYSARSGSLTVDGDNSADDGESGERDNVKGDVETVLAGSGNDKLTGGAGPNAIYGGGGTDTIDGGGGNDTIDAGAGDDTLKGGAGADTLAGGSGRDTADYSDRRASVYVSLGDGANDGEGGEGDDVAGDVETVKGGSGSDVLTGSDAAETLTGNNGDDVLRGRGGADTIQGGSGNDTIDFADRGDPVTVDLDANRDSDGDRFGDDIESAAGGAGNDRLIGGGGENALSGGPGNDTIDGRGDNDRIAGGDGWDTADYSLRTNPVKVTLDTVADDGQSGEGDLVLPDVEAVTGGRGDDTLTGSDGPNALAGGEGNDTITGRGGVDSFAGGPGSDYIVAADKKAETVDCGSGRDGAKTDKGDKRKSCEVRGKPTAPTSGTSPTPPKPSSVPGVNIHVVSGHGKIVGIPGFPGERVDRRLLPDIRWLRAKYHIAITDGYARSGHAPGGEHPIGEAIDIVPGPGGNWNDIDRLARFAEPRQNHPRAPWRWVGYNGDANHGRGNHLHLSWSHGAARRGHPAKWVQVLTGHKPAPLGSVGNLRRLAKASNQARGGVPRIRSHVATVRPCSGSAALKHTWRSAAKAFGLRWQILAAITQVESGLGCNMGPSSAGAIGWTQFMPATWKAWGMDASGDGKASPYNSVDAIFSTARYLRASGAPGNYRRAIYAYNHADWYVNLILKTSRQFGKVNASSASPVRPLSLQDLPREQTVGEDAGLTPPVELAPDQDETIFEE